MLFKTMGVGNYLKLSTQAESQSFTLPARRLQPDDRRFRIDDKATRDQWARPDRRLGRLGSTLRPKQSGDRYAHSKENLANGSTAA